MSEQGRPDDQPFAPINPMQWSAAAPSTLAPLRVSASDHWAGRSAKLERLSIWALVT